MVLGVMLDNAHVALLWYSIDGRFSCFFVSFSSLGLMNETSANRIQTIGLFRVLIDSTTFPPES